MPFVATNKGFDFTADNGVKGKLFHIKVPYPVLIIKKLEDCYVDRTLFPDLIPTTSRPIMANYEDREEIIENFKKQGMEVDVKQFTFGPMIGFCPKCKHEGTPSIQKKNTDTSYLKKSERLEIRHKVKGKSKYWLHFSHKTKLKHCWVQQWQGTIEGTFKPIKQKKWFLSRKKENKSIDPRMYLLSHAIKEMAKTENLET